LEREAEEGNFHDRLQLAEAAGVCKIGRWSISGGGGGFCAGLGEASGSVILRRPRAAWAEKQRLGSDGFE